MWQNIFEAGQSDDCSASFIQGQPPEICMTLFRHSGTAGSFLLLFIMVCLILGVPLILLALRLIEVISEKRSESASRVEKEATEERARQGTAETQLMSDFRNDPPLKEDEEWTPAEHMR